jgi:gamma-glutamyltranspeptidase/glutathione hydrolase
MTYTLNSGYGSGVTVPGLGFLLNNEMDDFAAKPGAQNAYHYVQGSANAIAPGKRPVSSMTPTIVLRGGKPFLLLGAPGGVHIPTHVLNVLLNIVDFGMGLQNAIDAPRFHHQWLPDQLAIETGISPDTGALLRSFGHKVVVDPADESARVSGILIVPGDLQGAWDGRGQGAAAGY